MLSEFEDRVIQIARSVLSGQLTAIEACWLLCPILHRTPGMVTEADYKLIIGVVSETDHLPIGGLRELWHPDFLEEKDHEIARRDALWGERVRAACERILLRVGMIN
jgi:hypothetical protein